MKDEPRRAICALASALWARSFARTRMCVPFRRSVLSCACSRAHARVRVISLALVCACSPSQRALSPALSAARALSAVRTEQQRATRGQRRLEERFIHWDH